MNRIYFVKYQDFRGVAQEVYVQVCECAVVHVDEPCRYYATDMGIQLEMYPVSSKHLGCGKDSLSPTNAVRRLISDHGYVDSIQEV